MPAVLDMNKIILKIADMHRKDSIQTYLHLLYKSYILLHMNLLLLKLDLNCDNAVPAILASKSNQINDQNTNSKNFDLVREFYSSCSLLADYYIL